MAICKFGFITMVLDNYMAICELGDESGAIKLGFTVLLSKNIVLHLEFFQIKYSTRTKTSTVKPDETGILSIPMHILNSGLDLQSQYTNYCYNLSP
jgi:hypothetical protein